MKRLKYKRILASILLLVTMLSVAQPIFAASGTGEWVGGQYASYIRTTDNADSEYGILIRKLINYNTGEKRTVFCAEHGVDFKTDVVYNGSYYTPVKADVRKACKIAYLGWYRDKGNYVVDGGISNADKKQYVLVQQYIWEVLKTLGITIIGFIVYMLIAQKIYFKGLVGNLFGGGASSSNKEINQKEYRNSKLYKSYVGKEFKNMARNPVFLMQCLIPAILIPIIMVVVVYTGLNSDGMGLEQITQMVQQMPTNTFFIACIILGVIQFFTMFIYISITAISRDGENAVFMKYIPVSLYKQYMYKIIPNIIMNIVTILITLGMAEYLLNLPVITLIALFVVATIMGILQSIAMIIVDLKRPKLNWDSEYAVAKQNLNLVFPVLLAMVNIVILVGFVYLLKDINVYVGVGILGILYIIATVITNKYLYNKQYELADKII